jgi:tRNA G37 N-methylase TrmD
VFVDQDVLGRVVSIVEWVSDQEVLITESPDQRLVEEWADNDLVSVGDYWVLVGDVYDVIFVVEDVAIKVEEPSDDLGS